MVEAFAMISHDVASTLCKNDSDKGLLLLKLASRPWLCIPPRMSSLAIPTLRGSFREIASMLTCGWTVIGNSCGIKQGGLY